MYRKLAALVLAAALLCSCSARVTVQRYPAELPRAESPAATPTPEPVPTFTEEQKSYGSAALLTDATVLVNVFLNDAAHGQTWDAESRAAAVQRTQLAVDWITEQAAGYEAAVNLICDRSADGSDSALTRSYLVQSAMQGGENSEESSAFLDEMDTLCASLAADSRLAAYGARHIAFLFFLPISGTSFTMAHYADDGDSFYYEYSCLYKTDAYTDGEAESPATYAHEILHLFGAPDLYEGSSDPYVDEALVSYVADTYPGDIMLSTYEDDGSSRFDAITKEISPLTAYCLGLTDTCPELAQFPLLANMTPGVFSYGADGETGSAEAGESWPGAVAVEIVVGEGFIPPGSFAPAAQCTGGINASPTSYSKFAPGFVGGGVLDAPRRGQDPSLHAFGHSPQKGGHTHAERYLSAAGRSDPGGTCVGVARGRLIPAQRDAGLAAGLCAQRHH